jgi:hypothetical protein
MVMEFFHSVGAPARFYSASNVLINAGGVTPGSEKVASKYILLTVV